MIGIRRVQIYLLYAYVALLPFEKLWEQLLGEGSIFKPYRIVGMALLCVWLAGLFLAKGRFRIDRYDVSFAVILSLGFIAAGFWYFAEGVYPEHSVAAFPLVLFGAGVYVVVKNLSLTTTELERIFLVFAMATLPALAFGLIGDSSPRIRGTYGNPNSLGINIAIVSLYLVARLLFDRRASSPAFLVGLTAALVAAAGVQVLTGARGAQVALVSGVLASLIHAVRFGADRVGRSQRFILFLIVGGAFAASAYGYIEGTFEERKMGTRYDEDAILSMSGRADIWRSAINVGLEHYGLGVGLKQYRAYHIEFATQLDEIGDPRLLHHHLTTHNQYIGLFTNHGIVGLGLYLAMLGSLILRSFQLGRFWNVSFVYTLIFPLLIMFAVSQVTASWLLSPLLYLLLAVAMAAQRSVIREPSNVRRLSS